MKTIPTLRDLEEAGVDAGALLDAHEDELARSIPMTLNARDRLALAEDIKAIRALREEWFGGAS